MKRFLWIIAAITSLAFAAQLRAGSGCEGVENWAAGPVRVYVNGGGAYVDPKADTGTDINKQWHWLGDVGLSYSQPSQVYAELFLNANGGRLNSEDGLRSYNHGYVVEGRLGYMWQFGCSGQFTVTPYTGLGYEHSSAHVSQIPFTAPLRGAVNNLTFGGKNWFVPAGVYANWFLCPKLDIGIYAEAQFAFSHEFWENYKATGGATKKITTGGKSQVNWLVSLPITWQFQRNWDLRLSPFFTYQQAKADADIGQDATLGAGADPKPVFDNRNDIFADKHKTCAFGALIGLGIRF